MFNAFNAFLLGAIWLAAVIGFGITGWRALHQGSFRAVSETYYGRTAQNLGAVCLLVAIVAGIFFVQRLLTLLVFGLTAGGLFFLIGAALGAYLTLRYYRRTTV